MSIESVLTFDTNDLPSEVAGVDFAEPHNIIFHVDLPWLTIVTETYSQGDKIIVHADADEMDADDIQAVLALVPTYSLRLPDRYDLRTLGVENEVTVSYWQSF